jgi:uncharacterized protein YoxC
MEASMNLPLAIVALSTPSVVLRFAAAFFLVVVGIGLIYACIRLGTALSAAEKLLGDVDTEVVPLLKQATETLDGVNTELDKVDAVMTTVVDATEKVDATTRAVEAAISVPAKKAAAFGAGVSQAVSSFFSRREPSDDWDDGDAWQASAPSSAAWSKPAEPGPADEATPDAAATGGAPDVAADTTPPADTAAPVAPEEPTE